MLPDGKHQVCQHTFTVELLYNIKKIEFQCPTISKLDGLYNTLHNSQHFVFKNKIIVGYGAACL